MSKPITSLVALQLVERGNNLDDPIDKYLPLFFRSLVAIDGNMASELNQLRIKFWLKIYRPYQG